MVGPIFLGQISEYGERRSKLKPNRFAPNAQTFDVQA